MFKTSLAMIPCLNVINNTCLFTGKQNTADIRSQKLNQSQEKGYATTAVDPLVVNFEEGMRLVN